MQKWEYCAIAGVHASIPEADLYALFPTLQIFSKEGTKYKEISKDDPDDLGKIIADLGEQGWEMVGCGSVGNGGTHALYFKRPI
jgi:hypothetical protein